MVVGDNWSRKESARIDEAAQRAIDIIIISGRRRTHNT